jgi:hypothetical protein
MNIQEISQAFSVSQATGVTVIDGKKAERKEIYMRANANGYGAGRKELVDANTTKTVGVTNLEKGDTLPNGKEYIVRGLKLLIAPDTDAVVKTATYGTSLGLPAFTNGELRIEQDGVLLNLPLRSIYVNPDNAKQKLAGEQYYEVLPFMIKSGQTFSISVEPVGAIAVDHCFELVLDVIEIATSAKVDTATGRN